MSKRWFRAALATLALVSWTWACSDESDDDDGSSTGGTSGACPAEHPGNATACQGFTPGLACNYDEATCTCSGISWNCVGGAGNGANNNGNGSNATNTTGPGGPTTNGFGTSGGNGSRGD